MARVEPFDFDHHLVSAHDQIISSALREIGDYSPGPRRSEHIPEEENQMDKHESVRSIPLRDVLSQFGFTDFKKRSGKNEWFGACPFHEAKKNKTSFSFTDEKFNCFSCGEHGSLHTPAS
jgi:hypothetical protein